MPEATYVLQNAGGQTLRNASGQTLVVSGRYLSYEAQANGNGYVQPGYVQPGYVSPGTPTNGYSQPGYVEPGYASTQ